VEALQVASRRGTRRSRCSRLGKGFSADRKCSIHLVMGLRGRSFFFMAAIATLLAVLTMTFPRQSGVPLFHLHISGLKTFEATTPHTESCWLTDPGRSVGSRRPLWRTAISYSAVVLTLVDPDSVMTFLVFGVLPHVTIRPFNSCVGVCVCRARCWVVHHEPFAQVKPVPRANKRLIVWANTDSAPLLLKRCRRLLSTPLPE
jgi:hypothetical protein